jgi:hypothetical protein
MSRSRRSCILVVSALALTRSGSALAQPTEAEKRAAAQALFDEARRLTGDNKYADACPRLLESYQLDPAIGTKFYLADCYEHIGRFASAWTYYSEVADEAHRTGAKDREKFAASRVVALKPRLPRIVVKPSPAVRALTGLRVERDGLVVGEGAWDIAIPVDFGEHTISATAPRRKPLELHVNVGEEGAEFVVEIPALEPLPAPEVAASALPPPTALPPKPVSSGQRIAGFVVGGVGVVSLGVGFGFGALAISKKNASNTGGHCNADDVCDMVGHQLRVDAVQAATVSTVLVAVGGAALVAGVVVLATAPSSKSKAQAPPSAFLSLGPLGASLHGHF